MRWNTLEWVITSAIIAFAVISFFLFRSSGFSRIIADSDEYEINASWNLPESLYEISGLSFLSEDRVACVQDEDGIVYIFNLKTSQIEREIKFSDPGDYEGIAVIGNTAYVVQSDGDVFEISEYTSEPDTQKYENLIKSKENIEGLCYDKKNNRLLLAAKGARANDENFRRIYAFDLDSKTIDKSPAYTIQYTDSIFNRLSDNILYRNIMPSAISVHPKTSDIYVLEGKSPKLLVLDPTGATKALFVLDIETFPQPEGITFSPDGDMYISNEGSGGPATIRRVSVEVE
ncbi:SdiA-regulated domain-containing protein [Altibacter sp. HG106]|uniref:SdiA-regulated domain-containing protein n=1 Tax=Altibacter sp. HG106 TaxID=3023937 RepID=UPI0023501394|nr:SdiA-regulated domain-containing protein [Altibacter sp. HG106]MDC7994001.1 SdiA-regulated domain-containing protein [Altibacter sp. HG106]